MSLGNLLFDLAPGGVSGAGNPPTETRRYVCSGTTSKSQVEALALAGTPAIVSTQYGILYRQDIRVQGNGFNNWRVEVPYGTQENVAGSLSFSFDTTGGTARITAGKEHIARYDANGVVEGDNPNGSSIEVGRDGEARGVDRVIPALKLTVDFRHPAGVVGIAKAKALSDITGTTNSDTFLTFAPGELLFAGATGKGGQQVESTVAYTFIGSPNETNKTIGDIIVAAKGHEHLWVQFEENDTDSKPGTKPSIVYVNRIYDAISFTDNLGAWG